MQKIDGLFWRQEKNFSRSPFRVALCARVDAAAQRSEARGQSPERKIVLLSLRAYLREGVHQKCTAIFCGIESSGFPGKTVHLAQRISARRREAAGMTVNRAGPLARFPHHSKPVAAPDRDLRSSKADTTSTGSPGRRSR